MSTARSGRGVRPLLKRGVQLVTVSYGRATSARRMLPTFLIAGAQRSGTTSMYRALSQHPAVLKPVLHKGVHYFDVGYAHGPSWYRAHFPTTRAAEVATRATGVAPVTFESSPYYLSHPLAPGRIAEDLPGVRVIVLLRDPVERAYSAHSHEVARGFEDVADFEQALDMEAARVEGEEDRLAADPAYASHAHQHQAYVGRGEYATYLERWERLVGRERMHVVDSHDFFRSPGVAFSAVTDFLGLPTSTDVTFERHNARARDTMPPSLRARLEDHFAPWDESLGRWLGGEPSWRR